MPLDQPEFPRTASALPGSSTGETASSRTRGRPGRRPRGRRPRTVGPGERRSSRARKSGSSSAGRKPTSQGPLAPQDAAEYVRLNVLLRGAQPQLSPQIIGRPDDVERLLDETGQRAQEVERGAAQAVEETAAVAAEEGEVDVAFGYLGGLDEGAAALAPTGGAAYGLARGTGWVLENTLFRPQQGSEDAGRTSGPPQHFTPRAGSSTSGSPASPASTDFEIQNVRVLASQVVLDSALVESFNRVLLSAAVQRPDGRGGAQRHRGTRLHETDGRPSGTTTRARRSTCWPTRDVAPISAARQQDGRCSWAACTRATP